MIERPYTLTLKLDADTLQYLTKFFELLYTPGKYVNGKNTLDSIREQLDTLKVDESYNDYQTTFIGFGTSCNDEV